MARPRKPNQRKNYDALNKRLTRYVLIVQSIYDTLANEVAKAVAISGYTGEVPFRFRDYPHVRDAFQAAQQEFVAEVRATIQSGISSEWRASNEVQDLLAMKALKSYGAQVNSRKYKIYFEPNNAAMRTFMRRKDRGLNLSAKVWKQARSIRTEMEAAISAAINKGTSAVTLSKKLSKYLHDYPSLAKDYKDKFGTATKAEDCEYRSVRLARSEINMAYRTAEQERWRNMDFILGYEIKLSHMHPKDDECDELAGVYPLWFKWTGWHPNDMCYEVPILMSEDEFWSDKPANRIEEMPENFKRYVERNSDRIEKQVERGTLPYYLRDNPKAWKEAA